MIQYVLLVKGAEPEQRHLANFTFVLEHECSFVVPLCHYITSYLFSLQSITLPFPPHDELLSFRVDRLIIKYEHDFPNTLLIPTYAEPPVPILNIVQRLSDRTWPMESTRRRTSGIRRRPQSIINSICFE